MLEFDVGWSRCCAAGARERVVMEGLEIFVTAINRLIDGVILAQCTFYRLGAEARAILSSTWRP